MSSTPWVVIAGPTASGKSVFAVEVAERLGAEIVSADSQAVYRHFEIGLAKPSKDLLNRVPHHLVSCAEPNENFSAAQFVELAQKIIQQLETKNKRVVIVGGTGLYLRALLYGLVEGIKADPKVRQTLVERASQQGLQLLYDELAQKDPQSAQTIKPQDSVRIIRALEIFELTGQKASILRERHAFRDKKNATQYWVLGPPRDLLYERINARTQTMFDEGLVEETQKLVDRGFKDTAPMRSVGYAQALQVVRGQMTLKDAIADAAQKTRHYAKRQLTWFRKETEAQWVWPPNVDTVIGE